MQKTPKPYKKLKLLPPDINFDNDINIYKALNKASRALAELKGEAKTIPNDEILINTLTLQEAKESSAIENIITTYDDIFRAENDKSFNNFAAKEVNSYVQALKNGFNLVKDKKTLTNEDILEIQKIIEPSKPGYRKHPGTVLMNNKNEIIYEPPQSYDEIIELVENLEKYINSNDDIDPLIKMAIIHYQFESIHPFYDGNGRTGRVINILYLVCQKILDIPILYFSRYIVENKAEYYKFLQNIREDDNFNEWIIWNLKGIEITSIKTIELIRSIKKIMLDYKLTIMQELPKIYSKDLLDNLFKHPYTKIDSMMKDLNISKPTAINYIKKLSNIGLLEKKKVGKNNYYYNMQLYDLFKN